MAHEAPCQRHYLTTDVIAPPPPPTRPDIAWHTKHPANATLSQLTPCSPRHRTSHLLANQHSREEGGRTACFAPACASLDKEAAETGPNYPAGQIQHQQQRTSHHRHRPTAYRLAHSRTQDNNVELSEPLTSGPCQQCNTIMSRATTICVK